MLTDPEFLKFLIQEKEQQKAYASPEQVKRLQAEINHATKLLKENENEE